MTSSAPPQSILGRLAGLPYAVLLLLFFCTIALTHLTLLRLPYYWDEGGYYVPAALDFYHRYTLIPEFTNAHPPLPNVVLGALWHVTGLSVLATRLMVCLFAAAALLGVFRLAQRLLGKEAAVTVTLLTAAYPIWFAQSTLAHADIFAAAFTLNAFALYLPETATVSRGNRRRYLAVSALFSLAALSKETAIVEPAVLAAIALVRLLTRPAERAVNLRWLAALSFPLLPLLGWYAYHHHVTGFTFGNPEYLRYNATANLTTAHMAQAVYYRALHLFWQRNIWLPIMLALGCLLLPKRGAVAGLSSRTLQTIGWLVIGNWLAFSVLGGALLTRYLLPVYPLILLVCVDLWQVRVRVWPWLALATAAGFVSAIWLNPPTAFAPEDNLTYRDMIVVHEGAIDFIAAHYPDARVLTAWPAAAELFRPDLGYVQHSFHVEPLENFTLPQIQKAANEPEKFDTALVFATHYVSPALERFYRTHPGSRRGREFAEDRDLHPEEVAAMLGGTVVWQEEVGGEWAAVVRFNRSYEALWKKCSTWNTLC